MYRSIAQHLVSNFKAMEALTEYTTTRIQKLREQLESTTDPIDIYRLQGQILENKKILRLREDALAFIEGERNGR